MPIGKKSKIQKKENNPTNSTSCMEKYTNSHKKIGWKQEIRNMVAEKKKIKKTRQAIELQQIKTFTQRLRAILGYKKNSIDKYSQLC